MNSGPKDSNRTRQPATRARRAKRAALAPVQSEPDSTVPHFCDYICPHAAFPPAETAGICRTMSAVHCTKLVRLVNKNARCEWRAEHAKKSR